MLLPCLIQLLLLSLQSLLLLLPFLLDFRICVQRGIWQFARCVYCEIELYRACDGGLIDVKCLREMLTGVSRDLRD